MDNIFDIWETIKFITDKSRRGYLSPEEVSKALDLGQRALWTHFLNLNQLGDEIAQIALNPFEISLSVTTDSNGEALYPSDYAKTESIVRDSDEKLVRHTLFNEYEYCVKSSIYPIADNPIYLELKDRIKMYPKTPTAIDWAYISEPTTPVIGYNVSGKTITYNPSTSVQLVFGKEYWLSIVLKALPYIGVNLSDAEVTSLSALFDNNSTQTK